MKWFALLLVSAVIHMNDMKLDFGKTTGGNDWRIVNDDVMGGRSSSEAYLTEQTLFFQGEVSLENNGGFASVRSPYERRDLSGFTKVSLRVRGTAREFALSFDTSRWWFRPNYKVGFVPAEDDWQEFTFDLQTMPQYRIGKPTGRIIDTARLSEVIRMGVILYDKKAGPFWLEIDHIRFHN